jgi:hypothetical protein
MDKLKKQIVDYLLEGLLREYDSAVERGKIEEWGKAAHAAIDLLVWNSVKDRPQEQGE